KQYLTHVRSMHTDVDLPFSATESPLVQRVIRGIKRYHGERDRNPKQPITLAMLTKLLSFLNPSTIPGDNHIAAAACTAYAGFLRAGEFTIKEGNRFSPAVNLTQGCLQFLPNFESATSAHLTLPASKTDPFRKGITIVIAAIPGCPTCAVAALKRLFGSSVSATR
ncbi:hypothetical protein GGU11DRAFT_694299, partial [Lentinula aff. detonsa]